MIPRLPIWLAIPLVLAFGWLILWPRPALGVDVSAQLPQTAELSGSALFAQQCMGCHANGGNVVRRGKTLRLAALQRAGLMGPEDVARVAAFGQGQMGGYADRLGKGGPEAVGTWVWQQALVGWPKSEPNLNLP